MQSSGATLLLERFGARSRPAVCEWVRLESPGGGPTDRPRWRPHCPAGTGLCGVVRRNPLPGPSSRAPVAVVANVQKPPMPVIRLPVPRRRNRGVQG